MNWKPTRGRCIVKLSLIERSMATQDNEVSYFAEVVAMGGKIDYEPEFQAGDVVKLEQLAGFKWEHDGNSYLVTPFHNIELVCDEVLEVTEQDEIGQ